MIQVHMKNMNELTLQLVNHDGILNVNFKNHEDPFPERWNTILEDELRKECKEKLFEQKSRMYWENKLDETEDSQNVGFLYIDEDTYQIELN